MPDYYPPFDADEIIENSERLHDARRRNMSHLSPEEEDRIIGLLVSSANRTVEEYKHDKRSCKTTFCEWLTHPIGEDFILRRATFENALDYWEVLVLCMRICPSSSYYFNRLQTIHIQEDQNRKAREKNHKQHSDAVKARHKEEFKTALEALQPSFDRYILTTEKPTKYGFYMYCITENTGIGRPNTYKAFGYFDSLRRRLSQPTA